MGTEHLFGFERQITMSETTKKTMTTWERLVIQNIVGKMPAASEVSLLRKVIRILDVAELTADEKAQLVVEENRPLTDEELDRPWDVWVNDPDALAVLKAAVKAHQWQGAEARRALVLLEKLGVE